MPAPTPTQLGIRGPGVLTWDGSNFATNGGATVEFNPGWQAISADVAGTDFDHIETDRVEVMTVNLNSQWQNLAKLFPTFVTNPTPHGLIYGTAKAAKITGAIGDSYTMFNAQITQLLDLALGVDSDTFAAAVQFTGLIVDGAEPEESDAYGQHTPSAESLPAVDPRANRGRTRWTATWTGKAGFAGVQSLTGWRVSVRPSYRPITSANYGTVNMTVGGVVVEVRGTPAETSTANLLLGQNIAQAGANLGRLASSQAAKMTLTGAAYGSIVVDDMFLASSSLNWASESFRTGELVWRSVRKITSGVAQPILTIT